MNNSRLLLAALLLLCGCLVGRSSADDELPVPQPPVPQPRVEPSTNEFPLEIHFYGYIQRSGITTVLIEIDGEPLMLRKDEEQEVDFGKTVMAKRLKVSEINLVNLLNPTVVIGFPKSTYLPQTCRLKKASQKN